MMRFILEDKIEKYSENSYYINWQYEEIVAEGTKLPIEKIRELKKSILN